MDHELIKANLNLYAVLGNLEDLCTYDKEMSKLIKNWDISIQFIVSGGPKACVVFKDGKCTVTRGRCKSAKVKLFFTSPAHCNKMFSGKASPIPIKGFSKLGFLTKDFPKLTGRLEYYLKPTDELLKKKVYLELNTRLTINTAAFAIPEIGMLDDIGKMNMSHMMDGVVLIKVLPNGPAANIEFNHGKIQSRKGDYDKPIAAMLFKNLKICNDMLNQKADPFAAVAGGDLQLKGQIGMLDTLNTVMDRIPIYLQ